MKTFSCDHKIFWQFHPTNLNSFLCHFRLDSDKKYRKSQSGALNSQLTDLGIKSQDLRDEQKIREKVKGVDDQFDLVMLADQFDESLILLAEKLCWKLEDLVTLKLNARSKTIKVRLQKLQISFHFIWRIIAQFGKHSEFVRLDN